MIRLLDNSDIPFVMQYLLENEIETVLMYGNVCLNGLKNNPELRRCADYYGHFTNGSLTGVIAFCNLGSCIPHYTDKDAIEAFAELMKDRSFEVVLGMSRVVAPLVERLNAQKAYSRIDYEAYMVNRNFKPHISTDAECFQADCGSDEHMAFAARINRELFDEPVTMEEQRKALLQKPRDEEFMLLATRNILAAQACVHCYTLKYGQIGAVGTLPEFRNRGYAKTVVSKLCDCIVKKGRLPTLMVRKNNAPAVRVYETLGFERYDDYMMVWY